MRAASSHLCDLALIGLAVAVTIFGALHYGWLNDDAQNYLTLASHVLEGKNLSLRPSWGDPYWAVFPAGYPLIIAAFKWVVGDALVASKLANGFLLLATIGLYAYWLRLPLLACSTVFLSVWGLEIASYSWSENAFFFAHALALSSLGMYLQSAKKRWLAGFFAGLLLCVFSRYIGGFLLTAYFFALAVCWKQVPRVRLFAAGFIIVLVGLCFAAYLYINWRLTGYPTGMARDPAPENFAFLAAQFVTEIFFSLWVLLPPIFLLWLGKKKNEKLQAFFVPERLLLAVAGSYLAILFVLRCLSRFEQFSGRMLSPGIIILGMALLKICYDAWQADGQKTGRVRTVWAVLFLLNLGLLYGDFFTHPELATTQSRQQAYANYDNKYGSLPDGAVIISGGYSNPMVGWHFLSPILGADRVFYALIDNYPLTYKDYRSYIARLRYKDKPPPVYLFDFTEFASIQSFDAMLKSKQIDPELTGWLRHNFKPSQFVACTDCQTFKTDDHDRPNP